jgi:hypothetical protein
MSLLPSRLRSRSYLVEWLIILLVIFLFARTTLLDFNDQQLQQTGEHNESATLPLLAEIGLRRYGEIPLWNPYMLSGFPHVGDSINHFWNPVATVPVLLWGGINGMKVSVFLSLLVAAYGQWFLAHTFGVRGIFRLWAGLLFALSGGLLLLWRLGWYELLVGAAWFPWCFALLWRALRRQDRASVVLTALAIAMVLTTGGGYYPLYLGISMTILTLAALAWAGQPHRRQMLSRAVTIALLGIALAAVYLVPFAHGLRYTARDAGIDVTQSTSQPIPYVLFNYVIADEEWFTQPVLNGASGYRWFYIGALPLLALAFTPWLFGRFPWRRRALLTMLLLLLVLLLWQANRYLPVRYLYDLVPFLLTFRFPNRLLIIATIPLIIVAAMNLQGLLVWARARWRRADLTISSDGEATRTGLPLVLVVELLVAFLLFQTTANVYRVNHHFAMHPYPRLIAARNTLTWLRQYDPSLYYVDIGAPGPYWNWLAYAVEYELPVLNFRYNRRVLSMDEQLAPESPFKAQSKYALFPSDLPPPEGGALVATIDGMNIWRRPYALPYAFGLADSRGPVNWQTVREQAVRLDGPNRVVVTGAAGAAGEQLVVLVSDYPGWRLTVDGQPAALRPLNGYLGAALLPGQHTYVFEFRPSVFYVSLGISLISLLVCGWLVGEELRTARALRRRAEMPPGRGGAVFESP